MIINKSVRYVAPDGTLTVQGLDLFNGLSALAGRVEAAEAKLAAIAAVSAPTGGATTDTEARAAINAIITGAA
jgi:hypothetical protein